MYLTVSHFFRWTPEIDTIIKPFLFKDLSMKQKKNILKKQGFFVESIKPMCDVDSVEQTFVFSQ